MAQAAIVLREKRRRERRNSRITLPPTTDDEELPQQQQQQQLFNLPNQALGSDSPPWEIEDSSKARQYRRVGFRICRHISTTTKQKPFKSMFLKFSPGNKKWLKLRTIHK